MSLSPEFDGTLTRKSTWKPLFTSILAPLADVLLIACGSGPVARSGFFFVGGPSQSFAARLAPDSAGNARAAWDVPRSMTGNVNVQVLTAGGTFVVVACTDLHS